MLPVTYTLYFTLSKTVFSNPLKDLKSAALIAVIIIAIFVGLEIIGAVGSIVSMTFMGAPYMVFIYVTSIASAEVIDPITYIQGGVMIFGLVLFIAYAVKTFRGYPKNYPLRYGLIIGIINLPVYLLMGAGIKDSLKYVYYLIALPVILLILFRRSAAKKIRPHQ